MDQQKTRYMPILFLEFQYNLTQGCIFFWPCSITSYIHPIHLTQFTPIAQLLWTQTRSNHRKNRWWFLSSQLKTTSFDGVFQWVFSFWQVFFQWTPVSFVFDRGFSNDFFSESWIWKIHEFLMSFSSQPSSNDFVSLNKASLNHHLSGNHKSQGFCWRDTLGFTSTGLKGEGERHTAIWRFILFRSGGNPEFEK